MGVFARGPKRVSAWCHRRDDLGKLDLGPWLVPCSSGVGSRSGASWYIHDGLSQLVGVLGRLGGLVSHLLFSCQLSECLANHSAASFSLAKPLITSVSPSGQRTSITQPNPGFFRATKVGRCSDILRICAYGCAVQASYPATIKPTHHPRGGSGSVWKITPVVNSRLAEAICPYD